MVPPSLSQREEVYVVLAVVIVHVGGAYALLHQVELALHPAGDVGVTGIEDIAQAHVREFLELQQALGGGKFVGNILQQDLHAASAGEEVELFQRAEGGIELAHIELLAAHAHVLDQVAEGNGLGDFDRPLDLVHHLQAHCLLPAR